ncbi:MAG: glycine oxidase ThiO [bacterium]
MQHLETQTVVVGAGLVGMAAARELARAGHVVHVVDRAPAPGAEASGAAAGMLAPQHESGGPGPFLDLCLQARDLWVEVAPELAAASGLDPEHRTDGFLHLALDEDEWRTFQQRRAWQMERGLPVESLSPADTARRFPMVTDDLTGALFYPGDHHLRTDRAVEAYAGACRSAGVRFLWEEEVRDFLIEQGPSGTRVAGVHTSGLHIEAEHTLLAAGAWTGRLTGALGAPLPVEPVRGQAAVTPLTPGEGLPPCLVGSGMGYLVPRSGDQVLAGATAEHVGFDRTTTRSGIEKVWEGAVRMLPVLEDRTPQQQWAGLRPGTPDGLPIVGPLPDLDRVWVDTGHFRNGILLAPLTGQLVARMIAGEDPGVDPLPFSPARFLF